MHTSAVVDLGKTPSRHCVNLGAEVNSDPRWRQSTLTVRSSGDQRTDDHPSCRHLLAAAPEGDDDGLVMRLLRDDRARTSLEMNRRPTMLAICSTITSHLTILSSS
ncbi:MULTISPECIES: hypothetical protein [unclassified Nocardioides]|uniref:hypothetical protein n=1 Tax=unclassified Nocardioides TaxID=2615069 RepID=UPI0009EFCD75|nr:MULTISPECIES: hypothetical protein [unclassified Nocardioides]GAW49181.1 hypothetical protein PD653B2_1501 [Nocardioides sp. PD653-B2]GAW55669.1 hypothetical protein PD653_3094 [Nocardioides sp. PD653]